MELVSTMANAKPTWFVDHNWQAYLLYNDPARQEQILMTRVDGLKVLERDSKKPTGYFKVLGREHQLGFHEVFVQDADTGLVPTPKSSRISIDTSTVRTWDHDRDGVAVQEPHEFSHRVVVVADGGLTAWDQAIQVVGMMGEAVEAEREQYEVR